MSKMNLVVIDYQMSNMFSLVNALDHLGYRCKITSDKNDILGADGAILPGVGAFPEAMQHLVTLGLTEVIREFCLTGKPLMGICLGLQLLFSKSEELGSHAGLDLIAGDVTDLESKWELEVIPHVGWNTVNKRPSNNHSRRYLSAALDGEFFYFVHSYIVEPVNPESIFTTSHYQGYEFCSSVLVDNIFACQFHPEKSGPGGLRVFDLFFR